MNDTEKQLILKKAKAWFFEKIVKSHVKNTNKLKDPAEFNINPFLNAYLANFLCGDASANSIAKALIYPRVLQTSITTTFGTHIQKFASDVLGSYGSPVPGIDIEFIDFIDGKKKYCQLKAGPNTINKDDIKTIVDHFGATIRLSRTNNLGLGHENFMVGILYGDKSELSGRYLAIEQKHHYPVMIGQEFWERLTGDTTFYTDLIQAFVEVSKQVDFRKELDHVIDALAATDKIKQLAQEASQ